MRILILCFALSGCSFSPSLTYHKNISYGQELKDLKEAYEFNAINEEEYINSKNEILNMIN